MTNQGKPYLLCTLFCTAQDGTAEEEEEEISAFDSQQATTTRYTNRGYNHVCSNVRTLYELNVKLISGSVPSYGYNIDSLEEIYRYIF